MLLEELLLLIIKGEWLLLVVAGLGLRGRGRSGLMAAVGAVGEELVMEQKDEWPREGEATAREGWFRLGCSGVDIYL
jgi:hypothetical protein